MEFNNLLQLIIPNISHIYFLIISHSNYGITIIQINHKKVLYFISIFFFLLSTEMFSATFDKGTV